MKIPLLRLTALLEGGSWLTLLSAMAYRAMSGNGELVSWTGRFHGGLFCAFALLLFLCWLEYSWKLRFVILIGLSSLIPFGFLIADPHLRRKQHEINSPFPEEE